jgi:hypothetical protein
MVEIVPSIREEVTASWRRRGARNSSLFTMPDILASYRASEAAASSSGPSSTS